MLHLSGELVFIVSILIQSCMGTNIGRYGGFGCSGRGHICFNIKQGRCCEGPGTGLGNYNIARSIFVKQLPQLPCIAIPYERSFTNPRIYCGKQIYEEASTEPINCYSDSNLGSAIYIECYHDCPTALTRNSTSAPVENEEESRKELEEWIKQQKCTGKHDGEQRFYDHEGRETSMYGYIEALRAEGIDVEHTNETLATEFDELTTIYAAVDTGRDCTGAAETYVTTIGKCYTSGEGASVANLGIPKHCQLEVFQTAHCTDKGEIVAVHGSAKGCIDTIDFDAIKLSCPSAAASLVSDTVTST